MRTVERLAPATQRALWKARLWFLAHRLGDTPLGWFDRSKQSRSQYRSDFRQHSNEFVASELDADVGIVLGKGDAPELFRLIARLCQKTGGAFPNEVRLSYLPLCAVMEMPGRATKSRVLVIGYPALQIWTADELCAVLAHEQGHWNGEDAQHLKPYVDQAEWLEAILSRKGGGTIGSLRRSWGKLMSQPIRHHSSQLAWEMEFAADRFAVEHTSPVRWRQPCGNFSWRHRSFIRSWPTWPRKSRWQQKRLTSLIPRRLMFIASSPTLGETLAPQRVGRSAVGCLTPASKPRAFPIRHFPSDSLGLQVLKTPSTMTSI